MHVAAVIATEVASLGSFLWERFELNSRVRAANVAGTSTTVSPAVISCWASKNPSPSAPSIAHNRRSNGSAHAKSCDVCARVAHTHACQFVFVVANHDRRVGRLVRVDTDDHLH